MTIIPHPPSKKPGDTDHKHLTHYLALFGKPLSECLEASVIIDLCVEYSMDVVEMATRDMTYAEVSG